jgi:hypothetical protein
MMSGLMIGSAAAQSLTGNTMYVVVKSVNLKSSTELFASDQGALEYGTQVKVLREKGKWVEVQTTASSLQGWMDSAGLTSKRITGSRNSSSVSVSELALAGKGFSAEVERVYKDGNELDYTEVDELESQTVSEDALQAFLSEGHLIGGN